MRIQKSMTNSTDYKLIIFDLDGTLAPFDSNEMFPDARSWWTENALIYRPIIATNQGGIGLRFWMESEGFGDPSKYPTLEDFEDRLSKLFPGHMRPDILMCARYQSKKSGKWCPVPPGGSAYAMWREDWRKPAPGMLLHALVITGFDATDALFVGDGKEDQQAAESAGIAFMWAHEFFNRPVSTT